MADVTLHINSVFGDDSNNGSSDTLAIKTSAGLISTFETMRDAGDLNSKTVDFIFHGGSYDTVELLFTYVTTGLVQLILLDNAIINQTETLYAIYIRDKSGTVNITGGEIRGVVWTGSSSNPYIKLTDTTIYGQDASTGTTTPYYGATRLHINGLNDPLKEVRLAQSVSEKVSGENTYIDHLLTVGNRNNYYLNSYVESTYADNVTAPFTKCYFYGTYFSFGGIYELITSAADLRAKRDTDLGVTTPTDWFEDCVFGELSVNAYGYPTDKSSYFNGMHTGNKPYAKTAIFSDFSATQNGQTINNYLERVSSGTDAIFESSVFEFDEPEFPESIVLHYTDTSSVGGEVANPSTQSATDRKIGIELMYSATKSATELANDPEPYTVFYAGLQSGTLKLDRIPKKVKSFKFRVTLADEGATPTTGTFQIEAVTLTTRDGILPQVDNFVENEFTEADEVLISPKLDNIIVTGKQSIGTLTLFTYGTKTPVVSASVKVVSDSLTLVDTTTDNSGTCILDYLVGVGNTVTVTADGFHPIVFTINETFRATKNIIHDMKPIIGRFSTAKGSVTIANASNDKNNVLV